MATMADKVDEMGHTIIRTKRHIKAIPISAEDYLKNEVSQPQKAHMVDRFNELIEHFVQLYKYGHFNKIEMKGNYMATNIHTNIPNMAQPFSHTNTENNELMR